METDIEKPELQTSVPKLISVAPVEQREATGRNRRFVLAAIVGGVVLLASATWWLSARNTKQEPAFGNGIATVRRADFFKKLRVNGTVEAVSYQPIAAPRLSGPGSGTLIITKLATSGLRVKKGALLVEFDRQTQIKNALDRQADYADFVQQINKKRADQATAEAVDQTALKQSENAMQSARLELKRNEIVSRI